MNMKFFPESYDLRLLKEKGINKELFLELQIKYKNDFEKLLLKIIDFKKIDEYIDSSGYNISVINDYDYNFYHKYSILGSKYIFFRNNIHIENLSLEELKKMEYCLINNIELDVDFLITTFKKVIYENGDVSMFGLPTLENRVLAKSLVFEFAYDQKKFTDVSQYNFVNQIKNVIYKELKTLVNRNLETEISMINYNAIPDIYKIKNK